MKNVFPQEVHITKRRDTLIYILKKHFPRKKIHGPNGKLKEILNLNPLIKNANLIYPKQRIIIDDKGTQIVLSDNSIKILAPEAPKAPEAPEAPKAPEAPRPVLIENEVEENPIQKSSLIGFYTASRGELTEKSLLSSTQINFLQNSFITLGVMYARRLSTNLDLSTSLYISKFNDADIGGQYKKSIPFEVGTNIYLERPAYGNFNVYGGADFERFNTVQMTRLVQNHNDFALVQDDIIYATAGLSYYTTIKEKRLIAKVSFARSFFSQITNGLDPYKGNRYQFFLSYPIAKNFSLSTLYKIHSLKAADREVHISRLGLGVGYEF